MSDPPPDSSSPDEEELARRIAALRHELESCPESDRAGRSRELAQLLNTRGARRWRRGDSRSSEDMNAALALDSKSALGLNNRACARADRGEIGAALEDLFQAIRLDPSLKAARSNLALLAQVFGEEEESPQLTTVGTVIRSEVGFCEALIDYLRQEVPVRPGYEDYREDAISEVVTRILETSDSKDLDPSDALRDQRRSSTRGWVRDLMKRVLPRPSEELSEHLPARPPQPQETEAPLLLREHLEGVLAGLLERSRVSVRRRRRLVWEVYVGSLLKGISLQRQEVVAAIRALGTTKRTATEGQILADLDLIRKVLKETRAAPS